MEIRRVAVICSTQVRDGLIMMVASHRLLHTGVEVVTFHNDLPKIANWFSDHKFSKLPTLEALDDALGVFDLIILQYDNTTLTKEIIHLYREKKSFGPIISIFYPHYSKYYHPPLTPYDKVLNKQMPMVDNVALAIASLLDLKEHSKNNGLTPPSHLVHRKYKNRVAILPSSAFSKKYQKIQHSVKESGFEVVTLDAHNLHQGAEILYESGYFIGPESDLCHLASNFQIPALVVSGDKKPISLWRPGWLRSAFITPPKWIPRAREHFIFLPRILSEFKKLTNRI